MSSEARVGTIVIGMRAGVGGLKKDLKAASGEVDRFSGLSKGIAVVAGAFAGFSVVRGAVGFLQEAAVAASDLDEQISATGATFGPNAAKISSAADEMAQRFGTVKTEFYESANGLGAIFKASGLSESAAADMSVQFTKLAADLASFRNLEFPDALEKIKAGLVGEAEPLRSVGVLLSEAAVSQEAYASGIAVYGAKLSEAQKVQARAAIITRQLSDAQGDLARTSGSVSNQMKAVSGRVQNFKADVGSAVSAITSSLTTGVNLALGKMVGLWEANSGSVQEWAEGAVQEGGVVSIAIASVGKAVGFVADTFQALKLGFLIVQYTVTKSVAVVVSVINLLGQALEAVINLIPGVEVSFTQTLDAVARGIDATAEQEWANFKDELGQPLPSVGINRFFADIQTGAQAAAGAAEETAGAMQGVAGAQLKLAGDVASLTDKLQEQVATFGMSGTEAELYKLKMQGATDADLANARALAGQLASMEASADARKSMESDAQSLIDSTRTEAEKQAAEMARAKTLLDAGLIDQDTFARATQGQADTGRQSTGAAALESGSAEARSALLAFGRQGSTGKEPIEDVKKNTGRQLEKQDRTNSLLDSILNKLAAGAAGLVGDLIPAA